MQGPYRSRAREDILAEAEMLARRGVKELIVIAQDITTTAWTTMAAWRCRSFCTISAR